MSSKLVSAALAMLAFSVAATADASAFGLRGDTLQVGRPHVQQAGFANPGGGTKDTCTESTPGNPEACDIDELTARCDAAGGGMSSLPGGGVDCTLPD